MELLDFIFNIDGYLKDTIALFGTWAYVVLFFIVFAETGLVIAPFLPGDSLLFSVGALAGGQFLNIWTAYIVMLAAAIIGDTVNYWIGYRMGEKIFNRENSRFFNKAYLEKTRKFYEKYGGKTIVLGRFLPIVRTFAPFVAGIGKMRYNNFFIYNITGGFIWVTSITFTGYFFGALPFVRSNFEYVVIGIVALSLAPLIFEYIKYKQKPKKHPGPATYENIQKTFKKEHLND